MHSTSRLTEISLMNINDYTALYSPLDIEYQQEYSGPYEDLSMNGGAGICIASSHVNNIGWRKSSKSCVHKLPLKITGYGRPVVIFGTDMFQRTAIRRLWKHNQDIAYMDYLVSGNMSPVTKFLLDKGYEAVLSYTQVINLQKTERELKHDLRKSYKSLITKDGYVSSDKLKVFTLKNIHVKVCGRHVRSHRSWYLQAVMVLRSEAFTCFDKSDDAGVLFYANGDWAYYACSKSLGPNTHHLIWKGMLELKARGVKYFEMGEQLFTDDKAGNISKFKRGFGGETKTRLLLRKKQ